MQTFIDLLFGNTLTRLVFFPALACLPLLFFPKGRDGAVKLYALAVSPASPSNVFATTGAGASSTSGT